MLSTFCGAFFYGIAPTRGRFFTLLVVSGVAQYDCSEGSVRDGALGAGAFEFPQLIGPAPLPWPIRERVLAVLVACAEFACESFAHEDGGVVEADDADVFSVVVVFLGDRVQGGDG